LGAASPYESGLAARHAERRRDRAFPNALPTPQLAHRCGQRGSGGSHRGC